MARFCLSWVVLIGMVLIYGKEVIVGATVSENVEAFDYKDALQKAILFFEGQRSGKLPSDQRATWRGDSGLSDGSLGNVDLKGGYYDAGDNVKFGWPMSFTVTMLSWAGVHYRGSFIQANQLDYLLQAIRWGTDYIMKAHTNSTTLWTQVGDGNGDHQCWERPEDMDTIRNLFQINASSPGTEAAADASAALSSASIVWRKSNSSYAKQLLDHSRSLFDFANKYRGSYQASCPFYCSYSGYNDELLWAAAWLYKATRDQTYLKFVVDNQGMSGTVTEFSWDNKFAGAQILLAQEYRSGEKSLEKYKTDADSFICALLPNCSTHQISITPGGLLFVRDGSNLQYVTSASYTLMVYYDVYKGAKIDSISCGGVPINILQIQALAKAQVDYILGKNPSGMSYMVGFGSKYPQQLHHRGSSISSVHELPQKVGCNQGFSDWYNKNSPNPNVHVGAVVGGPNSKDEFNDVRSDYSHLEPTTYMNAALVGTLAGLIRPPPTPPDSESYPYLTTNSHQQNLRAI